MGVLISNDKQYAKANISISEHIQKTLDLCQEYNGHLKNEKIGCVLIKICNFSPFLTKNETFIDKNIFSWKDNFTTKKERIDYYEIT